MNTTTDRFARQHDLVPRHLLESLTATVIGVGAIGRPVALQLAALGVHRLQLIDFDTVEPTNITSQGYHHADLGHAKVDATAREAQRIAPSLEVTTIGRPFPPLTTLRRRRILLR